MEPIIKPILAVDFDGTITEADYPKIGIPKRGVAKTLWEAKARGWEIIIWTCREQGRLKEAIDFLNAAGIPYDYVNNHSSVALSCFDYESRKVFATLYHDDRNVIHATWDQLFQIIKSGDIFEDRRR